MTQGDDIRRKKKAHLTMASMMGMAAGLFPYHLSKDPIDDSIRSTDPLKDIDIDKEYELIQKKESSLSASQREEVIYRWRQKYKWWERNKE